MKIVVNTDDYEILNSIIRKAKENGDEVIIAKQEKKLFELIEYPDNGAFVISGSRTYAQKAIDFIKRENQFWPVILMVDKKITVPAADIALPFEEGYDTDFYAATILHNIYAYTKSFNILQRLTAKMEDKVEFGECSYDPQKRLLYKNGIQVHKLSPKQGGIFELLAANFGQIVKKDIIQEKVWHQSNYFVGRSLDVFVTHLRKILEQNEINMTITNVSNIGLMLDYIKT